MTLDPTMLLYTYISRFSVTPHYIKSGRVAAINAVPQPFLIAVSTSRTNGPRLLSRVKAGHTRLSKKDRTQRLTRRNVCALDMAILEVSCYTDGHRKPLKNFFIFFENRVRNGAARASI